MKTLAFFLTMIFLTLSLGCVKEESAVQPSGNSGQQEKKALNMMRLDLQTGSIATQQIQLPVAQSATGVNWETRTSENCSANGEFSPIEGWYCTFSAMHNRGGLHGSATLSGPYFSIAMRTTCLIIEDNVAVYEGEITDVYYQDPYFCGDCLAPGLFVSFEVIDNGEGQNAPADQIGEYFWLNDESPCGELLPNGPYWGDILDVVGPDDQIQVK